MRTTSALGVAVLVWALPPSPARAQVASNPYEEEGEATNPVADHAQEAVEHFDRGVAFFEKQMFGAALAEFSASYALEPNWAVLYNIGVCYHRLGRYDDALSTLAEYMDQGGPWIYPERKQFVLDLIDEMEASCGQLAFSPQQAGVTLTVDGKLELHTPVSEPLTLTAGLHELVMQAEGCELRILEVSISVGTTTTVPVEVTPLATLYPWLARKKQMGSFAPIRVSALVLGGVAALTVLAGAILGGLAVGLESEQDQAILECWPDTGPEQCPRAYDLGRQGETFMWAANALFIAAGTMALTAMVLWVVLKLKLRDAAASAVPALAVGPVAGSGSFGITVGVWPWAG